MSLLQSNSKVTSSGFYDFPIEQSLRFDGVSSYLSRTPTTAGNRKTWTFSVWVKRTRTGTSVADYILGVRASNAASEIISFEFGFRADLFRILDSNPRTVLYDAASKIRDLSSWYHYVVKWDTTETLNTDRIKIYKNGELQIPTSEQSATVYPGPSDNISAFNSTIEHQIGRTHYYGGTAYYQYYLANIQFIDGQALDASYFGETKQDIWVPKAYTGSYGTNGFHLDFADSSNIGNDVSGNNNDWTVN